MVYLGNSNNTTAVISLEYMIICDQNNGNYNERNRSQKSIMITYKDLY